MQLVATSLTHPFRWIDALGVTNPLETISIPHRDNPPLDIIFDSGLGDGLAAEIDASPDTLDSFKFGAFVQTDYGSDFIVSNWDGAAFAVTKSSGILFIDGVTATSTTLTSATAVFTSADVGRVVTGSGIPSGTTITAVASATSVTLSAATTATATGVSIRILGRTPTYRIEPDFGSVELNDLFIDGTVLTIATEAARFALSTATAAGTIYRQTSDQTYWKVLTPASIAGSSGWTQDIAEKASVTLDVELEIVVSGARFTTQPCTIEIANDYIRGSESTPTAANPSTAFRYRADLTAFTGGGTTGLDGVDISSFGVGTVIAMVASSEGALSSWRLTAPLTITGNTLANPTIVTSTAHGLAAGTTSIVIGGSNSTPTIDGARTATYVGANTFSVPVNVTVAGTTGYFGPAESAAAGLVRPDTNYLGRYWTRIA